VSATGDDLGASQVSEPNERMDPALVALWERSRRTIGERFEVVERCVAVWSAGRAEAGLVAAARQETHRLAGSLSIFGFATGARQARELELLLRSEAPAEPAQAGRADELVAALRRTFGPRSDPAEAPAQPAGPPGPGPVPPRDESGPRAPRLPERPAILLAEDDDTVARVIETALSRDGCRVLRVRDGSQALDLARQTPCDLILLDVQMPEVDGFTVCRQLRDDPRLAQVPILMLTAHSDEQSIAEGFRQGATDYVSKPFAVAQLRTRVRMWLLRAQAAPP
jgi:CheY-like chemotaxis protein/HPt (histidine-containing phosphotransfer) domain-containing protein